MYGSKSERHFRVVQLDGKKVELGGVSITSKASPGSAARKLLTSIAHEKGLKKNKKASMPKVKFCIQEYTQGSSKKVYGPYVGHFHKYTAAELKKAATAKGKVKFTMKPVVKLAKGKNNMKGGGEINDLAATIDLIKNFTKANDTKSNKCSIVVGINKSDNRPIILRYKVVEKYLKSELSAKKPIFTESVFMLGCRTEFESLPVKLFDSIKWKDYCYNNLENIIYNANIKKKMIEVIEPTNVINQEICQIGDILQEDSNKYTIVKKYSQ